MDENRAIGYQNQLPWHLPADLAHFKKHTLNKPIIMGRKTYESIGRPLPHRTNIILTRDTTFTAEGCQVFHDLETALATLVDYPEVFIIGGATLFEAFFHRVDKLYLTHIHHAFSADTYFPEFDKDTWKLLSREDHQSDEKNNYDYSFLIYQKRI